MEREIADGDELAVFPRSAADPGAQASYPASTSTTILRNNHRADRCWCDARQLCDRMRRTVTLDGYLRAAANLYLSTRRTSDGANEMRRLGVQAHDKFEIGISASFIESDVWRLGDQRGHIRQRPHRRAAF